MLTHNGLPLSEPMAFGLASGISFAYLPLIKLSGMPLIAYRMPPRAIIRGIEKRLGIRMRYRTFRNPERGMAALDEQLAEGRLVGMQTSVFWLPYFPENMRFHFNAHNLLAYGRSDGDYLISDPVFEEVTRCDGKSLQKARFTKGALAARGLMYYPVSVPGDFDLAAAAKKAIRKSFRIMNGAPLPMIGIKGIRYLGKQIVRLYRKPAQREQYLPLYLSHIVRMQEEIGTGGAGFRFMYAAFLRETGSRLEHELLKEASEMMVEAGDRWRLFALQSSKMCRGRQAMDVHMLDDTLNACADLEARAWRLLKRY